MNESMDFIDNRLNCRELCLNVVWVRGDSNRGTGIMFEQYGFEETRTTAHRFYYR